LVDTPYLRRLLRDHDVLQRSLEKALEKHRVVPAGNGFIDLITEAADALPLLDDLATIGIAASALSLWCHVLPSRRAELGCPHGGGGPRDPYGRGWFSECYQFQIFEVEQRGVDLNADVAAETLVETCNGYVRDYLVGGLEQEQFYRSCLVPGFWLHVPFGWERKYYAVRLPPADA
jgi:hypothetical protein